MRNRVAVAALFTALALGLSACASQTAAQPSASAPASAPAESPSPSTPTPTETDASTAGAPAQPMFDGACEDVLSADQVAGFIGEVPGVEAPQLSLAQTTLGAVYCVWQGSTGEINAYVFPADVVADEFVTRYAEASCESQMTTTGCSQGVDTDNGWGLVTILLYEADAPDATEIVGSLAEELSAAIVATEGSAATPSSDWWEGDCSTIEDNVDLAAALGGDTYDVGYPSDAGVSFVDEIAVPAGALIGPCEWNFTDADSQTALRFSPYPGAGTQWDSILEIIMDAEEIEVPGATEAIVSQGVITATDGTNVLSVEVVGLDNAAAAAVAGDVMAALAG